MYYCYYDRSDIGASGTGRNLRRRMVGSCDVYNSEFDQWQDVSGTMSRQEFVPER